MGALGAHWSALGDARRVALRRAPRAALREGAATSNACNEHLACAACSRGNPYSLRPTFPDAGVSGRHV